ncbi:MAG TPA: hypothetical protein VNB29_10895 [Chthoniobacterales bacterium]|nr:hypothetical protein [Chthoniobacterales bacterium]
MPDALTAEKVNDRGVRHFSVFLNNKVGALLEVVKLLGEHNIIVLALSIQDSSESSICRFVVSDPDRVEELFEENAIPHSVSEVVVTELKEGAADLANVLAALLKAEVNVLFSYPLLIRPRGRAVLALHVDDNECATSVLRGDGFPILTQADLSR